jgi:hypothetical protein
VPNAFIDYIGPTVTASATMSIEGLYEPGSEFPTAHTWTRYDDPAPRVWYLVNLEVSNDFSLWCTPMLFPASEGVNVHASSFKPYSPTPVERSCSPRLHNIQRELFYISPNCNLQTEPSFLSPIHQHELPFSLDDQNRYFLLVTSILLNYWGSPTSSY